jgi:lysophospholipase L1-like esterase
MGESRNRLTVYGESTAYGFGVREHSFAKILAAEHGLELTNCAGFGATVKDSLLELDPAEDAAVVIAIHGVNEAMVRPTERSLRFVPPRYRRSGWMDPRAYFPKEWRRALPKRIESAVRWRVKVTLIRLTGGYHRVDIDEFRELHRSFIKELKQRGVPTIVLIGPPVLGERFFPYTPELMARYDEIVREQAREESVIYISAAETLRRWDDYFRDRLHASVSGHQRIVDRINAEFLTAKAKARDAQIATPAERREGPPDEAMPRADAAAPPAKI